jgi:hypothetical protein
MALDNRVRAWTIWALPFAVIGLAIAWETDFGQALKRRPVAEAAITPQAVNIALLPEYSIDGGIEGRRETIERTLFNPTRRPAPPQQASATQGAFPRGQFVLTGTTVVGNKATALLREVNGGRSRRVQQGETINGATVAEVRADRVKLTLGSDSEELTLKVAAGPRTTVQPAVAAPPAARPGAAGAAQPPQPQPQQNAQPAQMQEPQSTQQQQNAAAAQPQTAEPRPPGIADVADVIGTRRRARNAEGGAQAPQQRQ